VNAEVASSHANPVVEMVDNMRRQQPLSEKSMKRKCSPAGYQRRHENKDYVSTGEVLDARRRNIVEEIQPITLMGKWKNRHQDGGLDCSAEDRYAAKHIRREKSRTIDKFVIQYNKFLFELKTGFKSSKKILA
jgi:hypothetical protein